MFQEGIRNKVMAANRMNKASSRSHTIFTMKVESTNPDDPQDVIVSKLQLVDLAGSERLDYSNSQNVIYRECIQINKSLFTLRQVITSLSSSNQEHVPYRESKLTCLLKHSLGGNSYCLMIACLTPSDSFIEENINTLTYASKAKVINNKPQKNLKNKPRFTKAGKLQVKELKGQLLNLTSQLQKANKTITYLNSIVEKRQDKFGEVHEYSGMDQQMNVTFGDSFDGSPAQGSTKMNEVNESQEVSYMDQKTMFPKRSSKTPKRIRKKNVSKVKDSMPPLIEHKLRVHNQSAQRIHDKRQALVSNKLPPLSNIGPYQQPYDNIQPSTTQTQPQLQPGPYTTTHQAQPHQPHPQHPQHPPQPHLPFYHPQPQHIAQPSLVSQYPQPEQEQMYNSGLEIKKIANGKYKGKNQNGGEFYMIKKQDGSFGVMTKVRPPQIKRKINTFVGKQKSISPVRSKRKKQGKSIRRKEKNSRNMKLKRAQNRTVMDSASDVKQNESEYVLRNGMLFEDLLSMNFKNYSTAETSGAEPQNKTISVIKNYESMNEMGRAVDTLSSSQAESQNGDL